MTLNISELRRDYTSWPDSKSRLICQLLDIVEAVAKYKKSMDAADNDNSSSAMSKIGQSVDDLWELLDDVEVDDEL